MNTMNASKNQNELKLARGRVQAIIITAILGLIAIATIPFAVTNKNLASFVLTGSYLLSALVAILGIYFIRKNRLMLGVNLVVLASQFSLIVSASLVQSIGIPVALSILLITIVMALASLEDQQITFVIVTAIFASFLALMANTFPLPIDSLKPLADSRIIIGAYIFLGIQLALFIILLFRRYIILTLQLKILLAFLLVTLIPVSIIAFLSLVTSTNVVRDQANQSLLVAGKETASGIDLFFQTNLTSIRSEALYPSIVTFVNLPEEQRLSGSFQLTAQNVLQSLLSKDPINILSYALLDKNGINILDTDLGGISQDESKRDYFQYTLQNNKAFTTPLEFVTTLINTTSAQGLDVNPTTSTPVITFSAPILNGNGDLIGLIRVRYKADVFLKNLQNNLNLVKEGSYPILFDDNQFRLADPIHPDQVNKFLVAPSADKIKSLKDNFRLPELPTNQLTSNQPAFNQQFQSLTDGSIFTTNSLSGEVNEMGTAVALKSRPWTILYVQKEATVLAPVAQQTQTTLLLVYVIAAISGLLAIVIANWLSRPIAILTVTAQRISSGDLQATADIKTGDETELLAHTFNLMTAQLRTFISGLEERVQIRTQELAQQTQRAVYRAAQIQTLSDVARAITSVQDLEELLLSVTRLTSDRFNFYHVGIFLVDPAKEYAVLRATNSEGGRRMLARQHRLKIGQVGIVGTVAANAKPRLATDVGKDAAYFNNPDLPLTRSEMALPLLSGTDVIGVLDVQSTATNAFTEEDLSLFATLADQIVIAIVNNKLYTETRLALAEAQEVHRKYLRQEWEKEISENQMQGYQYDMHGLTSIPWQSSPEIEISLRRGETVTVSHSGEGLDDLPGLTRSALAVPIKLRGEVIGIIDLQDADITREWFQEEIDVVQAVADQVAVAMENARLFEQTVRRADREKRVMEITGKIRSSNDPQLMIKTAISELQQALNASRAQIFLQPSQSTQAVDSTDSEHQNGNGHHAQ